MTMVPTNPAQFLLGTNHGIIINFVSSKATKLIGPRIYRNDFEMVAEVMCISFSSESTSFCNPTLFYAIHSYGLLLAWDLAKSKKPESMDDLNLKDGSEAIGFSNGEVHLHELSKLSTDRDSRKRNKSLSNAIKVFMDI
uniref:Protein MAK11 n=1 Tax=Loa loa TaxID=7209 RepID=A0A1I7VDI7_LOALO